MTTAIGVKERPLLYSAPMVRAILSGAKTQTRRVFRMRRGDRWYDDEGGLGGEETGWICNDPGEGWWHVSEFTCPHGKPGDRLWVRESLHQEFTAVDADTPNGCLAVYSADCSPVERDGRPACYEWERPTLPSIHMPRWASRITLEITDVRVERVQSISEADIRAEGIEEYCRWKGYPDRYLSAPRALWIELWDAINAKRDGGRYAWDRNPWTWVVTFRRLEGGGP